MVAQWGRKTVLGAILVVAAGGALCGASLPFVQMAELWLADFRVASLSAPQPQDKDIVLLTITEETLAQFPYRSPVDRGFVRDLLFALEKRDVRAIGVDILFDQPTEADKDNVLKAALRTLMVPTVVSYARAEEGLTPRQVAFLDDFVPGGMRGFANLVKDSLTGTVRAIYPGRNEDGEFVHGFAMALIGKLGIAPPALATPIVWRAPPDRKTSSFRIFPAHSLGFLPAAWFKDRVILIGADLPLEDRHRTPFATLGESGRMVAGIEVHAHAMAQLMEGLTPPQLDSRLHILVVVAAAALGLALAFIHANLLARAGITLLALAGLLVGGFASYRYGSAMIPIIEPGMAMTFGLWLTDAYHGHSERRQKRFIKDAFSRYLSPVLVDRLVVDRSALKLGGEHRVMSYIFTDIAGFTALSENLRPTDISRLLNAYLGGLCEIVFRFEGTVVDFIGDAVFALFNAPLTQVDHAARAVACAREIDVYSERFRQSELPHRLGLGITRIGIHTGGAAVGNMGAETHFKYSPIGDAVNTASRIEGLNKLFGTRIAASQETLRHCPAALVRPLGRVVVKGRKEPQAIFEILDEARSASPYMEAYRRAYALMDVGDADALPLFADLHSKDPNDACVALHLRRLTDGHCDTLIIMTTK